jgi:hypothetical protein
VLTGKSCCEAYGSVEWHPCPFATPLRSREGKIKGGDLNNLCVPDRKTIRAAAGPLERPEQRASLYKLNDGRVRFHRRNTRRPVYSIIISL